MSWLEIGLGVSMATLGGCWQWWHAHRIKALHEREYQEARASVAMLQSELAKAQKLLDGATPRTLRELRSQPMTYRDMASPLGHTDCAAAEVRHRETATRLQLTEELLREVQDALDCAHNNWKLADQMALSAQREVTRLKKEQERFDVRHVSHRGSEEPPAVLRRGYQIDGEISK